MAAAERWYKFAELPDNIEDVVAQLPSLLAREGVLLAYLFGSLVEGRPANDVDVALLMAEDRPAYRLREAITERLGTERVDVVDLRRASPVLRFEVISTGRLLYAADGDVQLAFELAAIRQYQDTDYLRRQQRDMLKRRMEAWSSSVKVSSNARSGIATRKDWLYFPASRRKCCRGWTAWKQRS